jgi:ribosome-associated protein
VVLKVADRSTLADYFVICSAESSRQVHAIAEAVEGTFSKQGIEPLGVEGLEGSTWVLMDYGDFILHIFRSETREFYDLERLWADAPRIEVRPVRTKTAQHRTAGKEGLSFNG